MKAICFYFQVHQPFRIREYTVFDVGHNHQYFDEEKNRQICQKVADKCYLPMNKLLLKMIKQNDDFRLSFSISGVALEQFEHYTPEVLDSFQRLAQTGQVEFLSETYYHSLAFLYSQAEFHYQVDKHRQTIKKLFNQEPKVFRNTELIFNNELAQVIQEMGYEGIITEGADRILGWRSPNYLYETPNAHKIKVLLKNYSLSDDIAFRFSNKHWKDYPLTTPKFRHWIDIAEGDTINLFMDYETFGEHQWADTGIFDFMEHLPEELKKNKGVEFLTPSQVVERYDVQGKIDVHELISWADMERDLSAWLGNDIQNAAIKELYLLEKIIRQVVRKETGSQLIFQKLDAQDRVWPKKMSKKLKTLIEDWRKLTTSDHFYYMCTKWFNDGDVHKYFSPYESPYEAFINFMNVLNDLILRLKSYSKTG